MVLQYYKPLQLIDLLIKGLSCTAAGLWVLDQEDHRVISSLLPGSGLLLEPGHVFTNTREASEYLFVLLNKDCEKDKKKILRCLDRCVKNFGKSGGKTVRPLSTESPIVCEFRWKGKSLAQASSTTLDCAELLSQLLALARSLLLVAVTFIKTEVKFCQIFNDIAEIFDPIAKAMDSWSLDTFVPFAKYITVYPQAAFSESFDNEFWERNLPIPPPGFCGSKYFWGGRLGRAINYRVFSKSSRKKNLLFVKSWAEAKRGCATVPEIYVRNSYISHQEALLAFPKALTPDESSSINEFMNLLVPTFEKECVKPRTMKIPTDVIEHRLVDEDWINLSFKKYEIVDRFPVLYEPSQNASYDRQKSLGGARHDMLEVLNGPDKSLFDREVFLPHIDYSLILATENQISYEEPISREKYGRYIFPTIDSWYDSDTEILHKLHHDVALDDRHSREIIENPMYSELALMYEIKCAIVREVRFPMPIFTKAAVRQWYSDHLFNNYKEQRVLPAEVAAVREPLKVRMLTKGSGPDYSLGRTYQKILHKFLKKYEQFKLIGRPAQESDVEWMDSATDRMIEKYDLPRDFNCFVSGDYKGATDSLNINVSKQMLESLIKFETDENYKNLLRSCLLEHFITYRCTDENAENLLPFRQNNGQLMGSIMSFPFLCLANLYVYWRAISKYISEETDTYGFTLPLEELPALINGDDCGFRANKEFYGIWLKEVEAVGFKLSIGKNIVDRDYLMINSTLFYCKRECNREDPKTLGFRKLNHLNVGLLTGQNKYISHSQNIIPEWDQWTEVMNCTRHGANRNFLSSCFKRYHKDALQELSKGGLYNYFMPRCLGGLGFQWWFSDEKPKEEDIFFEITLFQLNLATYLYRRMTHMGTQVKNCGITMHFDFHQCTVLKEGPENFKYIPSDMPCPYGYKYYPEKKIFTEFLSNKNGKSLSIWREPYGKIPKVYKTKCPLKLLKFSPKAICRDFFPLPLDRGNYEDDYFDDLPFYWDDPSE